MRAYWDERARLNAPWYVDTSLSYDSPDMERFFSTGRVICDLAMHEGPVQPEGRQLAVEIGSGLGRICLALSEHFERVVGVDISPVMVERARELVPEPRVTFELGDGATLAPVSDQSCDMVVSFTVFQHIPKVAVIEDYIAEAGRVLRPGGVFAFQWNNQPGPLRWKLRRAILSTLQRTRLRSERYQRHAAQFMGSRVPVADVERWLDRTGLELRGTRGLGTLYAWAWAQKP